jgi:hypothetical protein
VLPNQQAIWITDLNYQTDLLAQIGGALPLATFTFNFL